VANEQYTLGLQDIYKGLVNVLTDDLRLLLVTNAYTPAINTDHFVSDIPGGAITARSGTVAGRAFSLRLLLASNVTLSLVAAGTADTYIILFKWTGSDATSVLLNKYNVGQNLPVTPIGNDIVIQWDPVLGVIEL
jgi:hypothetical protein